MMPLIFVYGTLKRGYGLNRMLEGCELVQPNAVLDRQLQMVDNGSFPYLMKAVKGAPTYKPTGEVYRVEDAELLVDLDRVEGAYDRTKAKTVCGLDVEFYLVKHMRDAKTMQNRYVRIDEAAGTATWGRTPFTGGEVQLDVTNAELIVGDDTVDIMRDDLPSGLSEAQIILLDAIARGDCRIKIAVDGTTTFEITAAHRDDNDDNDDEGTD